MDYNELKKALAGWTKKVLNTKARENEKNGFTDMFAMTEDIHDILEKAFVENNKKVN